MRKPLLDIKVSSSIGFESWPISIISMPSLPKLSFAYIFKPPSRVPKANRPWNRSKVRVGVEFSGRPRCCNSIIFRNLNSSGIVKASKAFSRLDASGLEPNRFLMPENAIFSKAD